MYGERVVAVLCVVVAALCIRCGDAKGVEDEVGPSMLIAHMKEIETTNIRADMTFKLVRTRGSGRTIRQEGRFEIVRGKGRFRAEGTDTLTGKEEKRALAYVPGLLGEIWSDTPLPGEAHGKSGFGSIWRGKQVNDKFLSRGRDGNWLFGYDFFLEDSNLPRRLSEADTERLTLGEKTEVEGGALVTLRAALDVGNYALTFDSRVGWNLVKIRIERRPEEHSGFVSEESYREMVFEGDITYTKVDGVFLPESGTARLQKTPIESSAKSPETTDFEIAMTNIALAGSLEDDAFRITWPVDSVAYDNSVKRNFFVNAQGEFEAF